MSGSVAAGMEDATARSQSYWLLSRLFLEVPDAALLAELRDALSAGDDFGSDDRFDELRTSVAGALRAPAAAAVAYTRNLCLGNSQAHEILPFEAHVREGRLPGESTAQVRALVTAAGYENVAPDAPSPDHLGAELRFMAFLCHAEREAQASGDATAVAACLRREQSFLHSHLLQWAPCYCTDLARRVDEPYVRAIARLAAASISDDARVVDHLCDALDETRNAVAPHA
ncbi:MAG: molecular chaperone TorD family protein [Betaproteobacteria bacterium]